MLSRATLLAVTRPTARAAHLGPAAVTVVCGAIPAIVALVRAWPLEAPLVILALVTGASLGWAGEDPSAELLSPLPVTAPVRSLLRAALVGGAALVVSGAVLLAVWVGPGLPPDSPDRIPEASTAAGAALALALLLTRRGERGVGPTGVAAGVLVPLAVAAFAYRWPWVPSFTAGATHGRWWIVAAVLLAVVLRVGRDPARY